MNLTCVAHSLVCKNPTCWRVVATPVRIDRKWNYWAVWALMWIWKVSHHQCLLDKRICHLLLGHVWFLLWYKQMHLLYSLWPIHQYPDIVWTSEDDYWNHNSHTWTELWSNTYYLCLLLVVGCNNSCYLPGSF